jgi:putative N6-adenine-specific DNA methylase
MCGSGTLLIEAALIARNMAPGIFRKNYAFEKWKDFDAELFEKIYNDDSKEREFTHHIYGYDQDWEAIAAAMQNVKAAGVTSDITLTVQPIQKFTQPEEKAIMVTNPPYGERISSPNLLSLYRTIGEKLKHQFVGNEAWIIGYREETFDNIGLRPSLKVSLYNGALNCTFCKYSIFSGRLNEFRSQGGVMKSDEERHRNAERKIFKPRREHVQNENTEFMEEDEIPDFIIRRHNEFVANQRREAHRNRREEDSRERKDYKKEYSSHSDRPRKDDERKFSGPKRPFDKGRGGGFKKNFGSHSKGGFQRRGKED